MKAKHKHTGVEHALEKKDWAALLETGHAKNFDVIDSEDFSPPELSGVKPVGKKADAPKEA